MDDESTAADASGAKKQEVIAIDGKALRRSHDRKNDLGVLFLVSAWSVKRGLSLGQLATEEKSNEITAIPQLINNIDVSGAIVTIDAAGCQKTIAAKIIGGGITERKNAERALRDRELQLLTAQKIQQELLPHLGPTLPGFEIAGMLFPAEFAAGDYYDFLPMGDGEMGIAIGDVSGHGFGPALIMASTHEMLRMLVETHNDIAQILTLANAKLHKTANEIVEGLCEADRGFAENKAPIDDTTAVVIKVTSDSITL